MKRSRNRKRGRRECPTRERSSQEVRICGIRSKVVGLYHGAMEFGPRALGHRSLLAAATDPGINSILIPDSRQQVM